MNRQAPPLITRALLAASVLRPQIHQLVEVELAVRQLSILLAYCQERGCASPVNTVALLNRMAEQIDDLLAELLDFSCSATEPVAATPLG